LPLVEVVETLMSPLLTIITEDAFIASTADFIFSSSVANLIFTFAV
jgi:hypothetical protein